VDVIATFVPALLVRVRFPSVGLLRRVQFLGGDVGLRPSSPSSLRMEERNKQGEKKSDIDKI
jgi:hypothetical protein